MTRVTSLYPEFVQFIPETLDEGVLYVSLEHRTVAHRCCCGCGNEVVTPLDPTQWRLIYDGHVSLGRPLAAGICPVVHTTGLI